MRITIVSIPHVTDQTLLCSTCSMLCNESIAQSQQCHTDESEEDAQVSIVVQAQALNK